ncbi:MAG TPA: serine/threonine-protein kinase [Vicinamibacterales bacterium]|nr:serine/threonine-protein kinase [Vicinamibacterales bacterium]
MAAGEEGLLADLAGAILDGRSIDWESASDTADDVERPVLAQLKLLAALATLHRHSDDPDPPGAEHHDTGSVTPVFWGHLRVLEPIGRGVFGEVHRAWDTRLDREVALKLLPAGADAGEARATSNIQEGRLQARVHHPNVVTIYGAERRGDRIGLWMELVRGRTLEQLLDDGKSFEQDEVVSIGIQLCHAMSAVHAAGLLHRDVKAQNVMLADAGRVVLMDFGTGLELGDSSAPAGTPLYLAPEVLRGQAASVRSDIYGLGVLLYHLLTRSYPVSGSRLADLRRAHERGERTYVRTARRVSRRLAGVIERAIDPEPARRYESADDLAADLAAVAAGGSWRRLAGLAACIILMTLAAGDAAPRSGALAAAGAHRSLLVAGFTGGGGRDLIAALQEAVTTELEQSPHLVVFPASRVRDTLARMKRPAATAIDEAVGLEICARDGVTMMVAGSIDTVGGLYLVRLRAMHAGTRSIISSEQAESRSRENLLAEALAMTRRLRQRLGDRDGSLKSAGTALEPVTSRSVDAVRQFTLGKQLYDVERPKEALPHFLAAIESDPAFAMAHNYAALTYGYLGQYDRQRELLDGAAALASDPAFPVSDTEREKILADRDVAMERLDQAAAHWRTLLTFRPADGRVMANLGLVYGSLRQYPESIAALEAAWLAYPHPRVKWMLGDMYSARGRADDAVALLAQRLDQPFDWIAYGKHLLIAGRVAEAEAALSEAERRTHQTAAASWSDLSLAQADFFRAHGRYRDAEAALQQGLDRGGRGGVERLELAMASLLVDSGRHTEAAARLGRLNVLLARNRIVHGVLAARAGAAVTASAVLSHLEREAEERRAPRPESRVYQLKAEIALRAGRGADAHALAARAVRAFGTAWTLETLARAQQAAGLIPEAIATWTTILERPGERTIESDAPAFSKVVLAGYELARLLERSGRADEARARYDEFLRRWADADQDLTVLADARTRRSRLGQGAQSTPAERVPKPAA